MPNKNSIYFFDYIKIYQMSEMVVAKTFKLTKKLGAGAFGEIFHGVNMRTKMEVAIKLEVASTKHP